jgi:hypothetical protein
VLKIYYASTSLLLILTVEKSVRNECKIIVSVGIIHTPFFSVLVVNCVACHCSCTVDRCYRDLYF